MRTLIEAIERNTAAVRELAAAVANGVNAGGAARGSEPNGTPIALNHNQESVERKTLEGSFSQQITNQSDSRSIAARSALVDALSRDSASSSTTFDWDRIVDDAARGLNCLELSRASEHRKDWRLWLQIVALSFAEAPLLECCRRVLRRMKAKAKEIPPKKRIGYLMKSLYRARCEETGEEIDSTITREFWREVKAIPVPDWAVTDLLDTPEGRRTSRHLRWQSQLDPETRQFVDCVAKRA